MILSIEAFVKQVNCISCGKLIEQPKLYCEECDERLQKDVEDLSNLTNEEINNDSNEG